MKLGDVAKDTITGFSGVITAEHRYLNGCVRMSLQPTELKDGKPLDAVVFDIEQLQLVQQDAHPQLSRTGGPEHEPARPAPPAR
jgi:hypothetical protein